MKKFVITFMALFTFSAAFVGTEASAASNVVVVERGSWLAWSEARYEWYYSSYSVSSSYGNQDSGWIFPNIVRELGITRYHTSSSEHKWWSKTSLSHGTPTPWGDVTFVSNTFTDYISLRPSGKYKML